MIWGGSSIHVQSHHSEVTKYKKRGRVGATWVCPGRGIVHPTRRGHRTARRITDQEIHRLTFFIPQQIMTRTSPIPPPILLDYDRRIRDLHHERNRAIASQIMAQKRSRVMLAYSLARPLEIG